MGAYPARIELNRLRSLLFEADSSPSSPPLLPQVHNRYLPALIAGAWVMQKGLSACL